jgi:hypothetical protein
VVAERDQFSCQVKQIPHAYMTVLNLEAAEKSRNKKSFNRII